MQRNTATPAIILNTKPLGENNTSVTLLTKAEGIVYATLYGGPKSKMRSLVTQWNSGIIYLYSTPEKNQIKISDFDVKNYHTSFSQSLFKMYAASLAGEIAIKTRCAGSNEQTFTLINGFLEGLNLVNDEQGRLGLIRFLWRYLELLGIQPDTETCARCEKSFINISSNAPVFAAEAENYYNVSENKFICGACAGKEDKIFPAKTSAIRYLYAVSVFAPSQARKQQIDRQSYEQLRNIVFFLIENNIESKLNTIETGSGIL